MRYRSRDDAVLVGPFGAITLATFLGQMDLLAHALPHHRYVINLCESRHGFMLGFAAALSRGQISLLPAGPSENDRTQLLRQFPDSYGLSEKPLERMLSFDLGPFLSPPAVAPTRAHPNHPGAWSPEVDAAHTAAILFTSGSTGAPTAHAKSWLHLWRGAESLMRALNWETFSLRNIVGSVSCQHMFGLETLVLLPWFCGVAVHVDKPLLAADLDAALHNCKGPTWWMTTPLHLRAMLRSSTPSPRLEGVVTSTMSLPAALAAEAETAWRVPVLEIFGSTETGALAHRRSAIEPAWTPLPGVSLRPDEDSLALRFWAEGPQLASAIALEDELELLSDGRFHWIGRAADVIKVGGRRASLADLNQMLVEIPGVQDGAFFFPPCTIGEQDHESRFAMRLAALYVSKRLSPVEVVEALRARIDPAFLPRPLYQVERLPRSSNGKLPQSALIALFLDAKAQNEAAHCSASREQVVSADHPALAGHFPENPVVPGVVLLSRIEQVLRENYPNRTPASILHARFHASLRPGERFIVHPKLRGDCARVEVRRAGPTTAERGSLIMSSEWVLRDA